MSGLSQLLAFLQPVTASSCKVLLVWTLGSQTLFSLSVVCVSVHVCTPRDNLGSPSSCVIPSCFMWDVCTGPFMDIYAHGARACRGQKIILSISPYYSPLNFLRQGLHRSWSLLIQLLPANPRDLPISAY